MLPTYTIQRIRKDDTLYGRIHWADSDQQTLCGQKVDHTWYILTNNNDGVATCSKCLRARSNRGSNYKVPDTSPTPKVVDRLENAEAERDRLRGVLQRITEENDIEPVLLDVIDERDRLRTALEHIVSDGCGTQCGEDGETCVDTCPDDKSEWCWCCIAKHALEGKNNDH